MKRILLFSLSVLLLSFTCTKKHYKRSTVIKDCTGVYLRVLDKDLPVCNSDLLSAYADGTEIESQFSYLKNEICEEKNKVHCTMVHPHATGNWIIITRIK